jgi:hypothetical protein
MKAEDLPELVATEHKNLGSHPSTDLKIVVLNHKGKRISYLNITDVRVNYETHCIEIIAKA